jgi:hypothetical protein
VSINISFAGSDEVVLQAISAKMEEIVPAVAHELDELDAEMQGWIVSQELHGQVLKQRSGKGAGSVRMVPSKAEGSSVTGGVQAGGGTAWYMNLFETSPEQEVLVMDIYPVNAKALRFIADDGSVVFAKHVRVNFDRPFMAPAQEHFRPIIYAGIEETVGAILAK